MIKLLKRLVEINNTGVTGQSLPPKNDFEHARGLRNSAYAVNLTYETYRHTYIHILEKWFPLQGERGHSSYFKNKIERRGRQNINNRPINLPKVITFSTDFKYTTQSHNKYIIYIHTYIHTYIFCSSQLLLMILFSLK